MYTVDFGAHQENFPDFWMELAEIPNEGDWLPFTVDGWQVQVVDVDFNIALNDGEPESILCITWDFCAEYYQAQGKPCTTANAVSVDGNVIQVDFKGK